MLRAFALLVAFSVGACSTPNATPAVDAGVSSGSDASTEPPFTVGLVFPDDADLNGSTPQLARDDSGALHILYTGLTSLSGATMPVRYGVCARGGCHVQSSWKFQTIGDAGLFGSPGRMTVSRKGSVHVVWTYGASASSGTTMRYSSCVDGCSDSTHWRTRDITSSPSVVPVSAPRGQPIALDSVGRAQVIFNNAQNGIAYATCLSNCATDGHWDILQLGSDVAQVASFLLYEDKPQLLYASGQQTNTLVYRTCDKDCATTAANWSPETGLFGGMPPMEMQLSSTGKPRVVFNRGNAGETNDWKPIYAQCDAVSCLANDAWSAVELSDAHDGEAGLSLSVPYGDGRPQIAFTRESDSAIVLIGCWSDCSDLTVARWTSTKVADSSALLGTAIPPVQPVCSGSATPMAAWYPGENVSFAAGPGHAYLAYDAYILQSCGLGNVTEALRQVRFAAVNFSLQGP